jgi:hypothetical protein
MDQYTKKLGYKCGFYGVNSDTSYPHYNTKEEYLQLFAQNTWLNHNDAGLSGQLKQAIMAYFPTKSIYEL